jgi:hypothetical protein
MLSIQIGLLLGQVLSPHTHSPTNWALQPAVNFILVLVRAIIAIVGRIAHFTARS